MDPTKMEKGENVRKNLEHLLEYCDNVLNSILNSINQCPL